jgi:hypothetical protein
MESSPTITSNLFGMLALRQYRTDRAVGIQRITPSVALFLDCYRLHRQREIEALSPLEWLRHTIRETRAEAAALSQIAQASDDLATVAATLVRVEGLTEYVQFLSEKLEGVAGG